MPQVYCFKKEDYVDASTCFAHYRQALMNGLKLADDWVSCQQENLGRDLFPLTPERREELARAEEGDLTPGEEKTIESAFRDLGETNNVKTASWGDKAYLALEQEIAKLPLQVIKDEIIAVSESYKDDIKNMGKAEAAAFLMEELDSNEGFEEFVDLYFKNKKDQFKDLWSYNRKEDSDYIKGLSWCVEEIQKLIKDKGYSPEEAFQIFFDEQPYITNHIFSSFNLAQLRRDLVEELKKVGTNIPVTVASKVQSINSKNVSDNMVPKVGDLL